MQRCIIYGTIKYEMRLHVFFFKTEQDSEPVREWLKSLPTDEKRFIGEDIKTVQFGWPLGMPIVRKMGPGLWEVRSRLKDRIAKAG
jgi:phage-related protein